MRIDQAFSKFQKLFQSSAARMFVERKLAFEQCEPRNLLAGNVTATKVGTTLNVVGDSDANVVFITKPTATTVTLNGLTTNVNGSLLPLSFTGISNLNVNLGAGSDAVVIARALTTAQNFYNATDLINYAFFTSIDSGPAMFASVTVEGGSGNDKVLLQMSTSGNVSVSDSGGLDVIALAGSTVRGSYAVDAGSGADFVLMENSKVVSTVTYALGTGNDYSYNEFVQVGAWTVDLGAGNNSIEFFGVNPSSTASAWRPLTVTGGTARDSVLIEGSRLQSIDINLGSGINKLDWWGDVQTTGNVTIQAGDGDDKIGIDVVSDPRKTLIGGSLTIDAGAGKNTVSIGDSSRTSILTFVTGAITINGGSAIDTINLFGVQTSTTLLINGFDGVDTVSLQLVTALTEIAVNLGAGNDSLTTRSLKSPKATLRGGADQDKLRLLGTNTITLLDKAEFES